MKIIKHLMNQPMSEYDWKKQFSQVEDQGGARIAKILKIMIMQISRLQKEFESPLKQEYEKARSEILNLFCELDMEIKKEAKKAGLSEEGLMKEVQKESLFTPEEWKQLQALPTFLKRHENELLMRNNFFSKKKWRKHPPKA
jgi:hypothetical protein